VPGGARSDTRRTSCQRPWTGPACRPTDSSTTPDSRCRTPLPGLVAPRSPSGPASSPSVSVSMGSSSAHSAQACSQRQKSATALCTLNALQISNLRTEFQRSPLPAPHGRPAVARRTPALAWSVFSRSSVTIRMSAARRAGRSPDPASGGEDAAVLA